MLDDLDRTLRALLRREIPDLEADEQVGFRPPGEEAKPNALSVNLFLYDVRENRDLRTNDWQVERRDDVFLRRRAPRRIDCSYLITAWAGDPLSEHLLLGQVMEALIRYAAIPDDLLVGRIRGQSVPTSLLQASSMQSLGEFWQALGNKPRAVLNYTVTIGVDPFEPTEVPAVTGQVTRIGQVLTSGGQP
jgi:hypothetical protein